MPISNFLALSISPSARTAPLRRGDLVFYLTFETSAGEFRPNRFAHVGIATQDAETHELSSPVNVLHLGTHAIEHAPWSTGPRVDLSGAMAGLDVVTRSAIIDAALAFYQLTPTIISKNQCCYLMGEPHPHGHPTVAGAPFGFSCATFAHHCYVAALPKEVGSLVATDKMPLVTDTEYAWLCNNLPYPIQKFPFRRLFPSYLIRAFEIDNYPFSPEDWETWKDHTRYIPAELLLTVAQGAVPDPPIVPS